MTTTVTHSGLLLLFYESVTTPDDIDGAPIIYFGKYGMPQGYFPATYFPITIDLDRTTPACRTFTIDSESRTYAIEADGTGSSVGVEPMGMLMLFATLNVTGTPTGRTYTIQSESRTYVIEFCTDDD